MSESLRSIHFIQMFVILFIFYDGELVNLILDVSESLRSIHLFRCLLFYLFFMKVQW